MPVVEGFNITPVKSTALLQPAAIDLRPESAVGDRRFLFVRAHGERLSGETKAPLMNIRSAYDVNEEHLTLTFPDGTTAEGGSASFGEPRTVKLYDREVPARRASVDDLGSRGGVEGLDSRRFRMLIEIADAEPFEEDTWGGRRIRIGDAVVTVGDPMPRCVVTTLNPDTAKKDFPTLDILASYRKRGTELLFGMYGEVEVAGEVRVGDAVGPI
ncbi:MAG: MOSC domain-containing protein [Actinobacteria bacterium]|nr:MAG: MOSC domain-containing protein [Actinomycetota bacterium]